MNFTRTIVSTTSQVTESINFYPASKERRSWGAEGECHKTMVESASPAAMTTRFCCRTSKKLQAADSSCVANLIFLDPSVSWRHASRERVLHGNLEMRYWLVGGWTTPSQIVIISPRFGVNIKNIWVATVTRYCWQFFPHSFETYGCFQNRGTPKWMVYNGKPY